MKVMRLAALAGALVTGSAASAQVAPGDTFSFDLVGFNNADGSGFYIVDPRTVLFGTTQTLAGAGIDGQDITISSSQVIGADRTTLNITVSTPVNFITDATLDGLTIDGIEFDVGNDNAGGDTLRFVQPIGAFTASGRYVYGTGNTAFDAAPGATLVGPRDMSLAGAIYRSDGGPVSGLAVHSISFSVDFANRASAVPEPATWATMVLGFALAGAALRRRVRPALAS